MERKDEAIQSFSDGYLCSQAVLTAFCEQFGLNKETALKLSQGFGGGFARCGETCGAVTGALMVIGLKEGSSLQDETPEKEKTYATVQAFIGAFRNRHGSIVCKELLDCDISKPDGYNRAEKEKLFETVCPKLVGDAVAILEKLMDGKDHRTE